MGGATGACPGGFWALTTFTSFQHEKNWKSNKIWKNLTKLEMEIKLWEAAFYNVPITWKLGDIFPCVALVASKPQGI